MNEYRSYFIDVIDSPDEIGYYAEVCNRKGKTIHTTKLFATPTRAQRVARKFVDSHAEE